MQVVFPTELDTSGTTFDANADMKRVGGPVRLQSVQEVTVEVYVDHSAVEVFLSTGEALATRCALLTDQFSYTCMTADIIRLGGLSLLA